MSTLGVLSDGDGDLLKNNAGDGGPGRNDRWWTVVGCRKEVTQTNLATVVVTPLLNDLACQTACLSVCLTLLCAQSIQSKAVVIFC